MIKLDDIFVKMYMDFPVSKLGKFMARLHIVSIIALMPLSIFALFII